MTRLATSGFSGQRQLVGPGWRPAAAQATAAKEGLSGGGDGLRAWRLTLSPSSLSAGPAFGLWVRRKPPRQPAVYCWRKPATPTAENRRSAGLLVYSGPPSGSAGPARTPGDQTWTPAEFPARDTSGRSRRGRQGETRFAHPTSKSRAFEGPRHFGAVSGRPGISAGPPPRARPKAEVPVSIAHQESARATQGRRF